MCINFTHPRQMWIKTRKTVTKMWTCQTQFCSIRRCGKAAGFQPVPWDLWASGGATQPVGTPYRLLPAQPLHPGQDALWTPKVSSHLCLQLCSHPQRPPHPSPCIPFPTVPFLLPFPTVFSPHLFPHSPLPSTLSPQPPSLWIPFPAVRSTHSFPHSPLHSYPS